MGSGKIDLSTDEERLQGFLNRLLCVKRHEIDGNARLSSTEAGIAQITFGVFEPFLGITAIHEVVIAV